MQPDFDRFAKAFRTLNADVLDPLDEALAAYTRERQIPFEDASAFAQEIIDLFHRSAIVQARTEILGQYLDFIQRIATKALPAPRQTPTCVALIPVKPFTAEEWALVHQSPKLPADLMHAADAAHNRNIFVRTVLEPLFGWLQQVDLQKALEWEQALVESQEVDPELARELLRAWSGLVLPPGCLAFALSCATEPQIQRQWPAVCEAADQILAQHALRKLAPEALGVREHRRLKRALPELASQDLRAWIPEAIEGLGQRITYFAQLATRKEQDDGTREVLAQELRGIVNVFVPLIVAGDSILAAPNGVYGFALAMFGFSERERRSWSERLHDLALLTVRRAFLFDLKNHRKPDHTIERLSFGDEDLRLNATALIDFVSGDFANRHDREAAVRVLAPAYADSREPSLRATEIGRRYRNLMRALHPDSIQRLLPTFAQKADPAAMEILTQLSTITTESRRFLRRRNEDETAEQVIAAELAFAEIVRSVRIEHIRRLLEIN